MIAKYQKDILHWGIMLWSRSCFVLGMYCITKKVNIKEKFILFPFTCRNIWRTSVVEKNSFLDFIAAELSSKVPSKWTGNNKYASWFQDPSWVAFKKKGHKNAWVKGTKEENWNKFPCH
jgi:hypothetical protein